MTDEPLIISTRCQFSRGAPGSIKCPCDGTCGYKVWLSPHAVAMMARGEATKVYCMACAKPLIEADPKPEFGTTDGTDPEIVLALIRTFGWPDSEL